MVGATSMTWLNWLRISPFALIPLGQRTIVPLRVPPQWEQPVRPLVGRVHGVGPANRIVVVRRGVPKSSIVRGHELGRLERGRAVEHQHLVERALRVPSATRRCRRSMQ
jgi:hypothetical protein